MGKISFLRDQTKMIRRYPPIKMLIIRRFSQLALYAVNIPVKEAQIESASGSWQSGLFIPLQVQ